MSVIPSQEEILQKWATKRILTILEKLVKSEILKIVCRMIIKRQGECPVSQIVYKMQDEEYSSVDTEYKLERYVQKINLKYDLPISFRQGYVYFDIEKI